MVRTAKKLIAVLLSAVLIFSTAAVTAFADELRESILPFWLKYGVDEEYGGILTCLDRDGSLFSCHCGCMSIEVTSSIDFAVLYSNMSVGLVVCG